MSSAPGRGRRRRGLWACMLAPVRLNWYRALRSREGARFAAKGLALGVFWACIPLFVFHIPLAFVTAQLLRVSRLAAVAGVFLANPFTIAPLFLAARMMGVGVLPNPDGAPPSLPPALGPEALVSYVRSLGWYDLWTVMLGGAVLGLICGGLTYHLGLRWALRRAEKRATWRRSPAGPAAVLDRARGA